MLTVALWRALTGRMSRQQALLLFAEGRLDALLRNLDPYNGRSVQEFAEAAAQIAIAAQAQAVSLATATQVSYLSEVGIDLEFVPTVPDEVRNYNPDRVSKYAKPRLVTVNGERVQRLPAEEIFNRPARQFRANVSEGMDEVKALAIATDRAKMLMRTNVALAEREATSQIYVEAERRSSIYMGYRRVIHPEASKSGTVCGLCLAASDRIYKSRDLKALHDNCNCETLPVTRANDPGRELNQQDFEKLYDLAGSTAAKHLNKVRFQIDEHGELGPVLVPSGKDAVQHFRYADVVDLSAARAENGLGTDDAAAA